MDGTLGAMGGARVSLTHLVVGFLLLGLGLGMSTFAFADGDKSKRKSRRIGYAPDPPPMREARQWLLTFRHKAGKVSLIRAHRVRLPRAIATPRRMGRYALELLSGPTIVERVRFDFPLLGADELAGRRRPYNDPPRFERKAIVTRRVMVPDSSRISRARIVDRATGATMLLRWPPVAKARAGAGKKPGKRNRDGGGDASVDGRRRDGSSRPTKDAAPTDAQGKDGRGRWDVVPRFPPPRDARGKRRDR